MITTNDPKHIVVVDPAMRVAEVECLNRIALTAKVPVTYHLPALFGVSSLHEEEPSRIAGIILLGSASSVNERLAWQIDLEAWLSPLLRQHRIPTLGLCYGHQMLAYMFGGRIDYMHADRRKLVGFREISLNASPLTGKARRGEVCVTHNEHVVSVPPGMRLLAVSQDCAVDGLMHEALPIVSLQSHPEAVPAFLRGHDIPDQDTPEVRSKLQFGHELVTTFVRAATEQTD